MTVPAAPMQVSMDSAGTRKSSARSVGVTQTVTQMGPSYGIEHGDIGDEDVQAAGAEQFSSLEK